MIAAVIDLKDLLIASVSHNNGETMVTSNAETKDRSIIDHICSPLLRQKIFRFVIADSNFSPFALNC